MVQKGRLEKIEVRDEEKERNQYRGVCCCIGGDESFRGLHHAARSGATGPQTAAFAAVTVGASALV